MFLDSKHFRDLLVRFLLEDVQVENGAATIGQLGNECHQLLLGEAASRLDSACFVGEVGQLRFVGHQLADALLPPQVVYRLRHHHSRHPCGKCAFATEREMGEELDKPIVQYVVCRVDIARIAVAYRKHLLGVKGVQFLTGGIFPCPATLYQFYLIFQCQCFFFKKRTPLRVICLLDAVSRRMLQDYF